jgi:hypothetical protein
MRNQKAQKIINYITAILVLVGGFYIIIFLPTGFSPAVRVLIGILLVLYFLFRVKYNSRKYGTDKDKSRLGLNRNKTLDK